MNSYLNVDNNQLVCNKHNHNQQILFAIMDEQIPFTQRFLCQKCLENNKNVEKLMPINSAIAKFNERLCAKNKKQKEQREIYLKTLKQFCSITDALLTKVIELFKEIQEISQQWITSLENIKWQDDMICMIKEVNLNKEKKIQQQGDIHKINQSYFVKLDLITKLLMDLRGYEDCYINLKQTISKDNTGGQIIKQQCQQSLYDKDINNIKLSNVQLVQIVKQEEWADAIAFNYTGTIMISGCNEEITVWKFHSGLSMIKRLPGHNNVATCLVFSKKMNWFASGSSDKTIRSWKEQAPNEWSSNQTEQIHKDDVVCLILNQNESQLISCSFDSTIVVWIIDSLNHQLQYDYTLENRHKNVIYCISLNECERELVSCSSDNKIILWIKDKNNKWIYKNHITNDDFGMRICFIDNDLIIWQQCNSGITHTIQIVNGNLIKRAELNKLNEETEDGWLFPTIYNQGKQIVIQKHNKYVYILQKQENGKLIPVYKPIDCHDRANYGVLNNSGEFLVIWDYKTKEFRIFNLKYQ